MARVRPVRAADTVEIIYTEDHWMLLRQFWQKAKDLMRALAAMRVESVVHGSVARGDVDIGSDVDVVVTRRLASYEMEIALSKAGFEPMRREIVMATPWHLPKAHIYLDEDYSATFPLVEPKRLEVEFYYFGGAVSLEQLEREVRVPGANKRLMLIEPTPQGHVESPIKGREAEVAKRIGVSIDIVRERVQVLTRRANIGRTGIFLQRELAPDESFEAVFEKLVKNVPAVKFRVMK
jgi:predicted nucleotidyltransferase